MKEINTPFTKEQVDKLNEYQRKGIFHPITCINNGDDTHVNYEFENKHKGEQYEEFLKIQKEKGIKYPEMEFRQTKLIATKNGLICPACNYTQDWAISFMPVGI